MNTLLTLHLVNIQPILLFILFLAGCLAAVAWMLILKKSHYSDLKEEYEMVRDELRQEIADEKAKHKKKKEEWLEHSQNLFNKMAKREREHKHELAKCQETSDMWQQSFFDLKSSLPKPRERDNDGKFVKGSSRLDNLRKHLLEGNRTDRFTAQESFGIAHVGKFISTLKKEGFDIRKERRKIAKDSFLTEYYLVPEKEAREWNPIEEDGVQTESAMNMGRVLRTAEK